MLNVNTSSFSPPIPFSFKTNSFAFAGAEVLHTTDYHMNPLPAHQVMSGPPPDVVPGHVNRPKNRLHDAVKYGSREGSR